MKTVFKYPFSTADEVTIPMPQNAQILSLQTQGDGPCIWALVDPKERLRSRTFRIFGTGHALPDEPMLFVGTCQIYGGSLVFHVFEVSP